MLFNLFSLFLFHLFPYSSTFFPTVVLIYLPFFFLFHVLHISSQSLLSFIFSLLFPAFVSILFFCSSPPSLSQLSISLPSFHCPSSFLHSLLCLSRRFSFCLSHSLTPLSLCHLLISLRTSGMRGLFIQEWSLRRRCPA